MATAPACRISRPLAKVFHWSDIEEGTMTSQELHHNSDFGEESGAKARWQKHVIVAIGVFLALLLAVTAALFMRKPMDFFGLPPASRRPFQPGRTVGLDLRSNANVHSVG
jgi:hypothetical protein